MNKINNRIRKMMRMKRIGSFFLWMALLLSSSVTMVASPSASQTDRLKAAEQAAYSGDYQAASREYEQLLRGNASLIYKGKAGKEWAVAEYNLGNCYYRLGERAKALLHYERALLLNPANQSARDNIRFILANDLHLDKEQSSTFFFIRWWNNLSQSLALQEWMLLCGIAFIGLLIGLLFYFFAPRIGWRKIGFSCALLFLLVSLSSGSFARMQYKALTERTTALIMKAEGIQLYASPSASAATVGTLPLGWKVTILDATMKGWLEIESPDAGSAWIRRNDVEII